MRIIGLLVLVLLLSACGSKLSGEYVDKAGMISYKFESGNKVYASAMGITTEAKYEIDGNRLKVEGNGQNVIYTILDDGSIDTGLGIVLTKK